MFRRSLVLITACIAILLLTGCNGVSINYLLARAYNRLTTPPVHGPVPTWTPAPSQLVTMIYETPASPIASEEQTPTRAKPSKLVFGKITANPAETMVNVRRGPSSMNGIVGTLSNGQIVEVTGRSPRGEWWRVKANGLEGWLYSAFVVVEDAKEVPCIDITEGACTSPGN